MFTKFRGKVSKEGYNINDLLRELHELRAIVAEVKTETDELHQQIIDMSFRVDRLSVEKLVVEKL